MERFRACFADMADPRTGNAQRHDLLEVLLIALCATLSGAETCVDMALFGEAKTPLLRRFIPHFLDECQFGDLPRRFW